mmetsp:Transcript_102618/g.313823  ORF Transcript_102618/g.313823 Transcript_102618/m.313823 type:complete len:335 (-) Transcript_102618:102-1106(-)
MCDDADAPREFPALPAEHPLQRMPMDAEHAHIWLNCPFAADCCALVGGRPFFLHAPYVTPHSEYFKAYFANGSMSHANRFMERLEDMPYPEVFPLVVEWMYTQREFSLALRATFATYRVASYLAMKPEFFDMWHQRFVEDWKESLDEAVFLEDALQARGIPSSVLLRIFTGAHERGVPIQGDAYLRVVLHWARHTGDLDEDAVSLFRERLSNELPKCTLLGLQREQRGRTEAFDLLVPPSAVLQLAGAMAHAEPLFACAVCKGRFHSRQDAAKVPCKETVNVHSDKTWVSNAGNTCCHNCTRPTFTAGCMTKVVPSKRRHDLVVEGKYKLRKLE